MKFYGFDARDGYKEAIELDPDFVAPKVMMLLHSCNRRTLALECSTTTLEWSQRLGSALECTDAGLRAATAIASVDARCSPSGLRDQLLDGASSTICGSETS